MVPMFKGYWSMNQQQTHSFNGTLTQRAGAHSELRLTQRP